MIVQQYLAGSFDLLGCYCVKPHHPTVFSRSIMYMHKSIKGQGKDLGYKSMTLVKCVADNKLLHVCTLRYYAHTHTHFDE